MSYDLSIGRQVEGRFLDATIHIAHDVLMDQSIQVNNKMNQALFNGGPLTPKSFNQLLSIRDPSDAIWSTTFPIIYWDPKVGLKKKPGVRYGIVTLEKKISFSAILGYLEGIPGIGTILALIHLLAHFIGMTASHKRLKNASEELNRESRSDIFTKTKKVYAEAINYTTHRNYLIGSALSIIPLVKPIARLTQGIQYHHQKRHLHPQPQTASDPLDANSFLHYMGWAKTQSEKRRVKKRNALRRAVIKTE